ncbi:hypothetical protein V4A88_RS10150, partial [Escherichia coli]
QEVVFPVRKEIKGTRGRQVRLGRGALRDQRGILALPGQRVRKEPPAQPGHRELKGIKVIPVLRDQKGILALPGQRVRKVPPAQAGHRELKGIKVIPVLRDQRGILALLGQKVRKELPAQPGHRDQKGIKVIPVPGGQQAHRDQLAHRQVVCMLLGHLSLLRPV